MISTKAKKLPLRKEKGFILILTMLIVSISLAISFSIYTISIKSVVLGAYMRESEKAFMAADRALECALFWDRALPPQSGALAYTIFATSSAWVAPSGIGTARCHNGSSDVQLIGISTPGCGLAWNNLVVPPTPTSRTTVFNLTFSDGTCADITVFKSGINTTITANGYNSTNVGNTRRTQRTIYARYNL